MSLASNWSLLVTCNCQPHHSHQHSEDLNLKFTKYHPDQSLTVVLTLPQFISSFTDTDNLTCGTLVEKLNLQRNIPISDVCSVMGGFHSTQLEGLLQFELILTQNDGTSLGEACQTVKVKDVFQSYLHCLIQIRQSQKLKLTFFISDDIF